MTDEVRESSGDTFDWNEDMVEEISSEATPTDFTSLVVYSRDWTIETINNQIRQENIQLFPKFQRRNAWDDKRRSRLIESFIIGIPVPEIVLAEEPDKKRSFLVIDGKQRLLTIAGFIDPDRFQYWNTPKLRDLSVLKDLEGLDYATIRDHLFRDELKRQLLNADLRCTIISNYSDSRALYDIFYRLNTGSVPLSSQELRQVLNAGPFADFLMETTSSPQPIHTVFRRTEPDPRLRDVEMLLRFMAFRLFSSRYSGTLRTFLDEAMAEITSDWQELSHKVTELNSEFASSIQKLGAVFEGDKEIARKYSDGKWETRLNKVLLEVQVEYFTQVPFEAVNARGEDFRAAFKEFCSSDAEFRRTIEVATNNLGNYAVRHRRFASFMAEFWHLDITSLPFNYPG